MRARAFAPNIIRVCFFWYCGDCAELKAGGGAKSDGDLRAAITHVETHAHNQQSIRTQKNTTKAIMHTIRANPGQGGLQNVFNKTTPRCKTSERA